MKFVRALMEEEVARGLVESDGAGGWRLTSAADAEALTSIEWPGMRVSDNEAMLWALLDCAAWENEQRALGWMAAA